MFKKVGPGVLVAAAFIGPGTVTVCTMAGISFGYTLLWAMLVSLLATLILQEMAARLGIITQRGLADVIRSEVHIPWLRNTISTVILIAIVLGNAAYEAGNIGGARLGLEALFGATLASYYPFAIGLLACALLYFGNYKLLEKTLITLVVLMSLSFIITAFMTKPSLLAILKGLFVPTIPENGILTVIALVGTTVVPYNLFLHASLVSEKWKNKTDLPSARTDTLASLTVGGFVSMAIIITAAPIVGSGVFSVLDLAKGLAPLYGDYATILMGIGLFSAGITSAITAPLAAAYVASSCFGWKEGMQGKRFKIVWICIIAMGVLFLSFDIHPIKIIEMAQVANGILLPVTVVFLIWAVNRTGLMGHYKNNRLQNFLGYGIVVLAVLLGAKSILTVFQLL
ncbi:Nramp family divalent metal transporter [Arenibacter sp. GZD96]|uniref:Nramp family divalent metal transporter n=1 Tax=Aurantibrevibacter litoralis TaxID=3106030 RepID=UPI002AFF90FA|nr:Nramp family divalent metal transporter [Arenibacter sp. GZD-96]MEA1787460.1 Nramp family divalent metal transporter [Arenibacter sp. GZD-96]